MRKWICFILLSAAPLAYSAGVPTQITYQGTLKEAGVPVNGARSMAFRLTNSDGTAVYWSSGNMSVNVVQGLFSTLLTPAGVDWHPRGDLRPVPLRPSRFGPRGARRARPGANPHCPRGNPAPQAATADQQR